MGVEFEVRVPDVEELGSGAPDQVVVENARRKALAVAGPDELVIGCDTEVVLDRELLGKAGEEAEARRLLQRLSGREHEVLSGLVVLSAGEEKSGVERSTVRFHELDDEEIGRYLASGEWRERAGAYAIQGLGSTLIAAVGGDVSNVIGLPIGLLTELCPQTIPQRR